MPKKSRGTKSTDEIMDKIKSEEIDVSMIICVTDDGERLYLHKFPDEVCALEFMEIMVAGLRGDILEQVVKRSLN